jgi:hypothetical protein
MKSLFGRLQAKAAPPASWAAYDDSSSSKRPGVLLFPDWTGVGDYAQSAPPC